jgi:hypothetical protein
MSFLRWLGMLVLLGVVGWIAGLEVAQLNPPPPAANLDALQNHKKVLMPFDTPPADTSAEDATTAAIEAAADKAFADGPYRKGEMILHAGNAQEMAALLQRAQAAGATILGRINDLNAARISFPDARSMANFMKDSGLDGFDGTNVELNDTLSLPTPVAPVDPYAPGSLLPFGNRAMSYIGVPADNANWGQGVTIAMLDTGISDGTANILKDQNVTQLDLTNSGAVPAGAHGDMVVSLLAGANGEQGIAPAASILSVQVLDANNEGDVFTVADGIYTAVNDGAQVLNLSLGSPDPSSLLQQAIDYALNAGAVVVAAAGNDGNGQISYPAAYPGVIAVGSVDATGQRATFSDYGDQMGLTAPGVGLNTVTTTGNESFTGTSASAPLIAGAVAALLSTNPGMTGSEATGLLTQYANFAGPVTDNGTNEFYGSGILNLTRVLNRNVANFNDVAVADMYLNITSMPSTPTAPMEVSIQNRGNTVLNEVQVSVNVNGGQTVTQVFTGLSPGDVRAVDVNLPVAQLFSGGVAVQAVAQLIGQTDSNPANNFMSRLIRVTSNTTSGSGN